MPAVSLIWEGKFKVWCGRGGEGGVGQGLFTCMFFSFIFFYLRYHYFMYFPVVVDLPLLSVNLVCTLS